MALFRRKPKTVHWLEAQQVGDDRIRIGCRCGWKGEAARDLTDLMKKEAQLHLTAGMIRDDLANLV